MGIEVEEGTWTMSSTSDTTDVTLSSNISDLSTAFVLIENCGWAAYDAACTNKNPSSIAAQDFSVHAYLWDDSGTTKIRVTRDRTNDNAAKGTWKVMKCTDDEFSVQRGSKTIADTDRYDDVTITEVSATADCICWINGMIPDPTESNFKHNQMGIAWLTSTTNLRIQRSSAVSGNYDEVEYRWIVIEFDTNKVDGVSGTQQQNVSSSYSAGSPLSLSWSGDKDHSMLFLQTEGVELDGGTTDQEDQVIGYIYSDTAVYVWPMDQNASTYGTEISWAVVDFGADLVRARSVGNSSWGNSCDDDQSLTGHGDVNNMISLCNCGYDNTTASYWYRAQMHTYCSSTTVLEAQRNPKGGAPDYYYQVLEFWPQTVEISTTLDIAATRTCDDSNTFSTTSQYIKSGGSSGDWTSGSNAEGSADGSCMSTSTDGHTQTLYPVQFSALSASDKILGIKVSIWNAVENLGGGHHYVSLYCTSLGASSSLLEADFYDSGTCSSATQRDHPWSTSHSLLLPVWLYDWGEPGTTDVEGDDLDGTDFYVSIEADILVGSPTSYIDAVQVTIYYTAGGTTYNLYPTIGIGINAAYLKSLTKTLDAGVGVSGAYNKSMTKVLSAGVGINASTILTKTKQLLLDIGIGISSVTSKSLTKALAAGVGISGTVAKSFTKKLSAGIGISGTVAKSLTKKLAAGIGVSGTVAKNISKKVAAGLGISATVAKSITKKLAVGIGINAVATASKMVYLYLNAGIGISAATLKSITKTLAAGVGVSATIAKSITKKVAAGVGISATKVKNITKALAAGIGISAAATALRTAYLNLSAGIGIGATKVKNITKALAAGIGINAAADVTVAIFLYLNAGIGISASYAKSLTKSLAAGVGVSAQVTKNIGKKLAAGIGINASTILTKTKKLFLDIGIGISSATSKSLKKVLSAGVGVGATATALRTAYLNLAAGVGISATKVKSITKALAAGIGVSATRVKSITKALAVGIGIGAAGIATKIGGAMKYLYLDIGVGINASAGLAKTIYRALSAGIGISITKTKSITKVLSAGVGISGTTAKSLVRKFAAGVGISATAPKTVRKALAVGVGVSTTAVKNITKRLAIGVGVSVSKVKNIIKRIAAGIGISSVWWKPIREKIISLLSPSHIYAAMSTDTEISSAMTADVISSTMTPDRILAPVTVDVLTAMISTSGESLADCITDDLVLVGDYAEYQGPEWYEGFWNSGHVTNFGGAWSLETTEKTAGTHSLGLDPGIQSSFDGWYEFDQAEIWVSGIDLTKYDGLRFDMKVSVNNGSGDMYVLITDYEAWWAQYDLSIAQDGEWHTYELVFNNYDYIDEPDFLGFDSIWAMGVYANDGTSNKKYIDDFEFFSYGKLSATVTTEDPEWP